MLSKQMKKSLSEIPTNLCKLGSLFAVINMSVDTQFSNEADSVIYVCFPRSPQGFPLQAFIPMTLDCNFCSVCTVTVVIFWKRKSFFLLTYLLTYENTSGVGEAEPCIGWMFKLMCQNDGENKTSKNKTGRHFWTTWMMTKMMMVIKLIYNNNNNNNNN